MIQIGKEMEIFLCPKVKNYNRVKIQTQYVDDEIDYVFHHEAFKECLKEGIMIGEIEKGIKFKESKV